MLSSLSPLISAIRLVLACLLLTVACAFGSIGVHVHAAGYTAGEHRYLYVAVPGVRNYLEYGGHGVLVFDMDRGHRFVKRIPAKGLDEAGKPLNVKGVCASVPLQRIYVSTLRFLTAIDLVTEQIVWERAYEGGCDRMALSPDGRTIYLPSLEKDHWHVVNAETGDVITKVVPKSGSHNTIYGLSGKHAYLAGLRSPLMTVTDTADHSIWKTVGPFNSAIRPFTVNASETLLYVNINGLLGFEVGDITTGRKLYPVPVHSYQMGVVKRHGCPSHGIGLTPDEREVWVTDAHNRMLHIFDNATKPPTQIAGVRLKDEPGWITFSLDGQWAYPSTGDIVEVERRLIVTELKDETGAAVQSEKMVEIHFRGNTPVRAGDQFGVGRKK